MSPTFQDFLKFWMAINALSATLPDYCGSSYDSIPPLDSSLSNGGKIQLQQVSLMIRHGDRMLAEGGVCWPGDNAVYNCDDSSELSVPEDSSYPTRLFRTLYMNGRNVYPGTCLIGQLTRRGEEQHQHNGRMLREAYIENNPFLSPEFNASQTYLRSDDMPRTFQSLQSLIETMYPMGSQSKTQILNVHSMDLTNDDLYPQNTLCPKQEEYLAESYLSQQYLEFRRDVQDPLMEEFRNITGATKDQVNNLWYLFDCMSVHVCHGFPFPKGISMDFYNRLVAANTLEWNITTFYPNVQTGSKLGIGFIFREIYQTMQLHLTSDSTATKFNLYSAHDTTLMPMLVALGVWDNIWTPYASMLHLELYADVTASNPNGDGWYVRFIYNGQVLKADWCGSAELCPFASFTQRYKEMTSQNPSDCYT